MMVKGKLKPLIIKALLLVTFAAAWSASVRGLVLTIFRLWPAWTAGDPASMAVICLFGPLALYLAQGLFYLPRREMEPPGFIWARMSLSPLVFLPLPTGVRVETGPALAAVASSEEREILLAEVRARMSYPLTLRLSLLLESRSPVDVLLDRLITRSFHPLSQLAWLAALALGPARLFMRLWGYFFFLLERARGGPGPVSGVLDDKRGQAFDLLRRERNLFEGGPDLVRLVSIRLALARVFNNEHYGLESESVSPSPTKALTESESIYNAPFLAPRYYGAYLDFPATFGAHTPDDLYDEGPRGSAGAFYPPQLGEEMERAALLAGQLDRLTRMIQGRLEDGLVISDGRVRTTWEVAAEADDLNDSLHKLGRRLAAHHRRCRTSALAAATDIGRGWPETLRSLAALLHLAEHGYRALELAIAELKTDCSRAVLLSAATGLFLVVRDVHERLARLELPQALRPDDFSRHETLPEPSEFNIKNWMKEWEPFVNRLLATLDDLRARSLTALLAAEDYVVGMVEAEPFEPITLDLSPIAGFIYPHPAPVPPDRVYSPALRFKVDPGRVILAAMVMGLLAWQSQTLWRSKLTIYNGLGREIVVSVAGRQVKVTPFGRGETNVFPGREYEITALAGRQVVENFTQITSPEPGREVYNVAGAAPLMEWTSPHGEDGEGVVFLGRPRWLVTRARVLFVDPPLKDDEYLLVLSGYGRISPGEMLASFDREEDRDELIRLHARWDNPGSRWFTQWQILMTGRDDQAAILLARLKNEPYFLDNWVRWLEGTSRAGRSRP